MIVPFPVPEGVTVHQEALLTAVQLEFEITLKLVVPTTYETFWLEGVTVSVGTKPVTVKEATIEG